MKRAIVAQTWDGPAEVEADLTREGRFGVHRGEKCFVVTEVATGLAVWSCRLKRDALEVRRRLEAGPWPLPWEEFLTQIGLPQTQNGTLSGQPQA